VTLEPLSVDITARETHGKMSTPYAYLSLEEPVELDAAELRDLARALVEAADELDRMGADVDTEAAS
jgi:hypothetical protein